LLVDGELLVGVLVGFLVVVIVSSRLSRDARAVIGAKSDLRGDSQVV
jgi:hypothetical protein